MSEEEELKKLAKKLDMLERLADNGDIKAQKELEKEIIKRIEEGNDTVIKYLIKESHVFYITDSDFRNTDKDTIKKLKNEVSLLKLANPARDGSKFHKYLLMEKFKEKEDDRDFIKKLLKYNLTDLFNIEIIQEIISETNFIQNLINMIKADWMYTEWFGHVISDLKSVALNQTKEKIFDILTKGTPAEQKIILTIECDDYFESKDSFFKNRKKFIEIFSEEFLSSILTESNSKFIENLMQQSEVTIDSFEGVLEYILEKIKNVNFVSFKNKLIEIFKTKKFIWIENFRLFLEILHESGFYRFDEEELTIIVRTLIDNYHQLSRYWEKESHYGEEHLFMHFSELVKYIPNIFIKVISEVFEKDDDKIIKILIENLFWGLSPKNELKYEFIYEYRNGNRPSHFDNISITLKSKILKYLIRGLDDSKYSIPLYVGEVGDLIEKFYKAWDKPENIFLDEVTELLKTGTGHQCKGIISFIIFFLDGNLLNNLNYSNLLILKNFLEGVRLQEETEDFVNTGGYDKYHEELRLLGKEKIYELSKNLFMLLEEGDDDVLLTIIRLRWLEHLDDEKLLYLLENQEIKFLSRLVNLIKDILSNYDIEDDVFFTFSLFQRICNLEDKQYFYSIVNQLNDFMLKYINILELWLDELFDHYERFRPYKNQCIEFIDFLKKIKNIDNL